MHEVSAPDSKITASLRGGVFALGNFDGVHRGHQAVVRAAIDKARGMGIPARVLTLEPHPRTILRPELGPFRLTPADIKIRILRALGVDDVIIQPFTTEFAQLSAADFAQHYLINKLGVQHVIAGYDFVFGHNREGNMQLLRQFLAPHGVGVTEVTPFRDTHGEVMSSSRTRDALRQGKTDIAQHILGRSWSITGVVQRGDQRATSIGFPTANIALGQYLRPKYGVYAVLASRVGEFMKHQGVANIGVRPTLDGNTEWLEVHLLNFNSSIYGQEWQIELLDFMRPEQSFPDVRALQDQIRRDVETAKTIFSQVAQK